MSEEEKNVFREFYKKASADSSNQMWANDIMRRFSSSLFAMFNSALTFDKLKEKKRCNVDFWPKTRLWWV
nr:hypothetical protein [Mycoplasmopsis bovis]